MRKARDVSYRRKFDLKQVEKAQNKRQWILLGVVLSLLACLAVAGTTAVVTKHYMLLSAVVLVGSAVCCQCFLSLNTEDRRQERS